MSPTENILDAFRIDDSATKQQTGKRVLHQLPKNPADRCTIVSIFPRQIVELKPTLFPGRFVIPAAPKDGFSLFIVESSSYYIKSQMERAHPTEVQVNSAQLAKSIVDDYLSSIYLASAGNRGPGVFWIPGEYNQQTILKYPNFDKLLEDAKIRQNNWYIHIINEADTFWAKSHGDPRSISDDARMAAEQLSIKGKPWMANQVAASLSACPACGEMINKIYPVCKFCHAVIDADKAKDLNIKFAQ